MHPLRLFSLALLTFLVYIGPAHATTWDEPWHREVVTAATSLGLYKIDKSGPDAVTLKLLKHVAGDETGPIVQLNAFYALRMTSSSGHGPEFRLPAGEKAYFYLKRAKNGWAIATPTAGFAPLQPDGKVAATYRISVHQTLVDAPLYEASQRCIFLVLHGKSGCDADVMAFIKTALAKPAGSLADPSPDEFFRQHAALETAGFIRLGLADDTLERFLSKPDMHVQISAVRALAASARADKAERLMRFAEDGKTALTARIVTAILLKEINAREMKQRLSDLAAHASEEEAGLGIALMDPRIGTSFPYTLKLAAKVAADAL